MKWSPKKDVFRTFSNICDGAFSENSERLKVAIFVKKLPRRCFDKVLNTHLITSSNRCLNL